MAYQCAKRKGSSGRNGGQFKETYRQGEKTNEQPKEVSGSDAEPQPTGFIPIARRDAARAITAPLQAERRLGQHNNSYQVLMDAMGQTYKGEERWGNSPHG